MAFEEAKAFLESIPQNVPIEIITLKAYKQIIPWEYDFPLDAVVSYLKYKERNLLNLHSRK